MKNLYLLSLLLLLSVLGVSQDYQSIKSDADYFFSDGIHCKTISIDSIAIYNDSLTLYNYPVFSYDNETNCYTNNAPSWIGRKMTALPDGENIFFNMNGQFITIETLAGINETWTCFSFNSGSFIMAKVESHEQMEFLGFTDNVKTITFQAMDELANPIAHEVNDMYLLLSQNYGFIRTINFNLFPDLYDYFHEEACHEYELCGISEPETGIMNLTAEKIYDFEIGDEYHYHQFSSSWVYSSYSIDQKYINQVINKELIGDDKVKYTFKRCAQIHQVFGEPAPFDTLIFVDDTTSFTYYIGNFTEEFNPDILPGQVMAVGNPDFFQYYWFDQDVNTELNKLQKTHFKDYYSVPPHTCIEEAIIEVVVNDYYIEGLGGPYWEYEDFWQQYFKRVTYFKKGNEVWGEPFICDSLLVSVTGLKANDPAISVAPNPMQQWTKISIDNPESKMIKIALYNAMGKLAGEWFFNANELIIKRNNLRRGMYFYKISDDGGVLKVGKIVID